MLFRFIFRLYLNALLDGKPLAVVPTLVIGGFLSFGVFSEGIAKRDPVAIGLLIVVGLMLAIVVAVAIVDRQSNKKKTRPNTSTKRPATPGGRR